MMRIDRYRLLFFRWLPGMILGVHLLVAPVWAAEEGGGWRTTYDEIMRWVNFGIFVLVIVKFARKPLAEFLQGQKEEVADEIQQVESQKQQAEATVEQVVDRLNQSSERLEEIKARIINQGEKRKALIIAEAQAESETMLKTSKVKIKGQIANARNRLKSEMIDTAIDLALKRLPDEMSATDNTRLVNDFTQALPK